MYKPANAFGDFDVLRRFAPKTAAAEQCELCAAPVGSRHRHLLELNTRQIRCACEACGILFSDESARRYRRIPEQVRVLDDFQLTDAQWESLAVPIGLAFFFQSSATEKICALYPSPAGAAESLLDLDSWRDILNDNPVLETLRQDVEALLINRIKTAREYFIVPIDECYRLVGIIRTNWRGLSGGPEVWKSLDEFFSVLRARAGSGQRAVRSAERSTTNAAA